MLRDRFRLLLLLVGFPSIANALWMLAEPLGWYRNIPADVPGLGPFNQHFVRDIGCAYLAFGIAAVWAAYRPVLRFPLVFLTTVFYGAHALVHVQNTLTGAISARHWLLDLPLTYAPAVLLAALSVVVYRRDRVAAPAMTPAEEDDALREIER